MAPTEHTVVVGQGHGNDGRDELTVCGEATTVALGRDDVKRQHEVEEY